MKMKKFLSALTIFLLLVASLLPGVSSVGAQAVPADCKKIGANSAAHFAQDVSFYQKAKGYNMGWTLEIARADNPGATVQGINSALARGLKPIVRIGVGTGDDSGFFDPQTYIGFLNSIATQANGPFYAVAGPNEPDSERWLDPKAKDGADNEYDIGPGPTDVGYEQGFTDAGKYLAVYMNAIIGGITDRSKTKLLSPSINLSSWSGAYMIEYMSRANANWSGLDGFSGTSYSFGSAPSDDVTTQTKKVKDRLPGMKIILTELGNRDHSLTALASDVAKIKADGGILGALLFNVFNTNPGWSQFALTDTELAQVLGPGCYTGPQQATTVRPTPTTIPCQNTTGSSPEFHPLRPYPGSPCDPLIPRASPFANQPKMISTGSDAWSVQQNKDYGLRNSVVFACGQSLTPNSPQQFDLATGVLPPNCTQSGSTVTCLRDLRFDLTLDMRDSQIPILGNTQIRTLTDTQKMTEYLSWYLNGTVQQAEQFLYSPQDEGFIKRLVNFSGPLQKLLAFDLKNWDRSELVTGPVGEPRAGPNSGGEYHNYIVGCEQYVNLDLGDYTNAARTLLSALPNLGIRSAQILGDVTNILTKGVAQPVGAALIAAAGKISQGPDAAVQAATEALAVGVTDPDMLQEILGNTIHIIQVLPDLLDTIGDVLLAFQPLTPFQAITCTASSGGGNTPFKRLKDFRGNLPPDPTKEPDFATYRAKLLAWRGYTVLWGFAVSPLNPSVWSQLFQNIPFSSLEDTTGEVVISVSDQTHAAMQDEDVVNAGKPIILTIKKKP